MYPVSYEADFNGTPNRVTTFFRLILAIPWLIVAYVYGLLTLFTHFFAWVAVVILGRYPQWLYDFNSGVVRFQIRLSAWMFLQTDEWPPFGIGEDPRYPIRVNFAPRAERQSRLKAFFRLVLLIPSYIVATIVVYAHLAISAVAWLTIVFRGYLPAAVDDAMTFCNAYYARYLGYYALLTDDYPPVGIEKAKSVPAAPAAAPAPPTMPPPAPTA
jgi:hypothetical protein